MMIINWRIMLGLRIIKVIKPILLEKKGRILGDCMICTEMCGNGVKIVGMKTIKMHQIMEVVGTRTILKQVLKFCAAALGSMFRGVVVQPIGTDIMLSIGLILSVFGLLCFFSSISCLLFFVLCLSNTAVRRIDCSVGT